MRAEVTNAAVKKEVFSQQTGENLAQGDGTGRQLIIWSPLTNLTQGDGVGDFNGRSIHPRGIQLKGSFGVPTGGAQEYTDVYARWTLFWSRSQADYGVGGTVLTSSTTAAAAPVQVPPFANPRIFDAITFVYSPYVGDTFGSQFDTTNIKVLATKTIHINPGATLNGVKLFKIFMRFPKRRLTWNDPGEQGLTTAPNFPLNGNYYLILQVFGPPGTGNVSATTIAIMDLEAHVYWKDVSG